MKTVLVLEGGAMRGMYSAGVIDAFLDHGVDFDGIVGVSAGACFGCNLFSKQRGRVLRYNTRFMGDPRNVSVRSLITTGDIINRQFAYYEIPRRHDIFDEAAFEAHGGRYTVVVTNVETGKAEYMDMRNLLEEIEKIRASASMPFVSRMVELDGKKYLDGGCADSIPVRAAMEMGYDRIVVVLTQPADYVKGPMNPKMIRTVYRQYPAFCETLLQRHETYNAQSRDTAQLEKAGRVYAIRPQQALQIKRLEKDPEVLRRIHALGLADGEKHIDAVRAYLKG